MNVGLAADLDYQPGGQCADERVTAKIYAFGQEIGNRVGEILAPIQPTKPVLRIGDHQRHERAVDRQFAPLGNFCRECLHQGLDGVTRAGGVLQDFNAETTEATK